MLVGRPELSTLRRIVVQYGHWYIAIHPDDRYTYLRPLCDFTERKNRMRCVVYAIFKSYKIEQRQSRKRQFCTISINLLR